MKLRKEIFFDSDESYENSQCRASKDQTEMANCDGVVLFFFEHLTRRLWGSLIAFNWQLAVDNRLLGPVSIAELFLIRLI